jgi:hypothetical protein
MVAATLDPAREGAGRFYVCMAAVFVLVAFGSFAGTYWLQLPAGTFIGGPIIHLHAALFSAWTLLFLTQTMLAANGAVVQHRAWGLVGVSLATAMLLVGLAASVNSVAVSTEAGHARWALEFMIVPVSAIVLFAGLFAAAVANRARPEWHKRLMLVATAGLLQAAVGRLFFLAINGGGPGVRPGLASPQPVAITVPPGGVVDLLIVAAMLYDWRTLGRPHPAYWVAGGITLVVQLARLPLAHTPAWLSVAHALTSFSR